MIVYGASGHGKVIIELLEVNSIYPEVIWDDGDKEASMLGYQITKPNVDLFKGEKEMIISIGDNKIRKLIAERNQQSFVFKTVTHPQNIISKRATIGNGTVIMAGVVINSEAVIGKHCIINTCAVIEHDCIVEDYVHISPNATLCGDVSVGEGTHIGAGAVIIQGIKIGKWCTVGAGTVVIRDVEDHSKVVGSPGRLIKQI